MTLLAGSRFTVAEPVAPQVRFVVNWSEELKRLVPTE
jgi:hypothetical protein